MASTKEYRDYILEQLKAAGFSDVVCRAMMGEYLLYVDSVLIGGVYDDRFLVKRVPENEGFGMEEVLPYPGARPMWLVGEVDDVSRLAEVVEATVEGLKKASVQVTIGKVKKALELNTSPERASGLNEKRRAKYELAKKILGE